MVRQLSIVSFLRNFALCLPPLSLKSPFPFFSFMTGNLMKHLDLSWRDGGRGPIRSWKGSEDSRGREAVQDSCPTYSGRLRDLNGNISLPPSLSGVAKWKRPSGSPSPIHFLERFSNSFCTSAASFPPISLPTVIHSELALCSFQPFARGTLGLLSVRGKVSFAN